MKNAWHSQFKRASKEARTDTDGTVFHSKAELHRWKNLQLWQLSGEIRNLQRQVKYPLIFQGIKGHHPVLTPKGKVVTYDADFVYEIRERSFVARPGTGAGHDSDTWIEVIEDFKGHMDTRAQFKIAVFEAIYQQKVHISK